MKFFGRKIRLILQSESAFRAGDSGYLVGAV